MESGLIFRRQLATKIQRRFHIFFGRCINVVELTLFQRGIRVDFSSASFNDVVTTSCNRRQNDLHFQHFYNVVSTLLDVSSDVISTLYRRLLAHWVHAFSAVV